MNKEGRLQFAVRPLYFLSERSAVFDDAWRWLETNRVSLRSHPPPSEEANNLNKQLSIFDLSSVTMDFSLWSTRNRLTLLVAATTLREVVSVKAVLYMHNFINQQTRSCASRHRMHLLCVVVCMIGFCFCATSECQGAFISANQSGNAIDTITKFSSLSVSGGFGQLNASQSDHEFPPLGPHRPTSLQVLVNALVLLHRKFNFR